jgi:O-succinylbenzoic acid--CoA ligase
MVPFQVTNTWLENSDMPPVRILIIGGAEISMELEKRVRHLPVEIYATYGMAETCSHIAVRRVNGQKPEKWYRTLPGITVETDHRNCLVIKAPYLVSPVITNDLVEPGGNGRFRWLGRIDNLINSGGIKIVPEEVESVLTEKTGNEFALIGLPDPELGQRPVLVTEMSEEIISDEDIRRELAHLVPSKVLPVCIIRIDKFPRNASFKIDRRVLVRRVYEMP